MTKRQLLLGLYFGVWFLYFAAFWSRAVGFDEAGNLVAYHINIWGDWAAHFTIASSQAYRQLWLTTSPFLVNGRFSYPFIADLIPALLMKTGVPLITSFLITSFGFSCLLVCALYYFYKTLFRSAKIAVIASLIFLLNGGTGFYYFAQDIIRSPAPLETLISPPHEYTRIDKENIRWVSVIDSMIIPQRAFALGFPLTLIALALIYSITLSKNQNGVPKLGSLPQKKLIVASILLGCLPLIHTHSFLAAGIILTSWSGGQLYLLSRNSPAKLLPSVLSWSLILTIISIFAIPQLAVYFWGQVDGFILWYPGWLASEFKMNWLVFWFKNWGVVPLLALLGVTQLAVAAAEKDDQHQSKRWKIIVTFLPFFLIFIIANLWLFQPWSWDNTKLIVWASAGFSGLAAYALVGIGNRHSILATLIFLFTIASGTIDAYWIQGVDLHQWQMYSQEELELAEWSRANTDPNSIWITADNHNHWLFNLTGRQTVMAYRGWLWTQGYDYLPIEADLRAFFINPQEQTILEKYDVDYIVVGPAEINDWSANVAQFQLLYPVIKETTNYRIYQAK